MKHIKVAAASSLLVIAGVGFAGNAAAAEPGKRSATDVIAKLEAEGHHVQLNGPTSSPLSQCKVNAVHGLNDSNIDSSGSRIDEDLYTTVYVDLSCPNI